MSKQGKFAPSIATGIAVWRSWKSMKTWVMVWLWYLNVLYWLGLFWLDRPEAQWALISYVAIGPLIAGVVWPQRGFTRLSGLIHLPWLAYTLWLGLRLWTETPGGLYGIWLHVVFWSTALCLAFDIVDVVRWLRGTRYRLGTPAAVAAGASKPAAWQD